MRDPDQAPISYGNDILTLRKALSPDEFQAMLDRAEDLAANGDRCKPNAAFDTLQVDCGEEADPLAGKLAKRKPIVPLTPEEIHKVLAALGPDLAALFEENG